MYDASWSPDGAWIATASGDGTARIWDAKTGAARFTLEGHTAGIDVGRLEPRFRPPRHRERGRDRARWEITEQGAVEELKLSAWDTRSGIIGVAFSPDGTRVMAGNFGVSATLIWDVTIAGTAEWANLPTAEDFLGVADFTPDGAHLVASGPDRVGHGVGHRDLAAVGPHRTARAARRRPSP